jgi:hypothetical protein
VHAACPRLYPNHNTCVDKNATHVILFLVFSTIPKSNQERFIFYSTNTHPSCHIVNEAKKNQTLYCSTKKIFQPTNQAHTANTGVSQSTGERKRKDCGNAKKMKSSVQCSTSVLLQLFWFLDMYSQNRLVESS